MLLIDKLSAKPVYEQIADGYEKEILTGVLFPGDTFPSLRELSVTLGINPNTIQKAYAELARRGVMCSAPGSGCYVTVGAREAIKARARERLTELRRLAAELCAAGLDENEITAAVSAGCADVRTTKTE